MFITTRTLDQGTKQNVFRFSFVPYLEWQSSHGHNLIRSSTIVPEVVLTPPTLPGFYPHSDGPLRARCILGFDLKPRSITTMMDLGCWDAAIYRAISKGSGGLSQSSEQGGGCHCQSTLEKQIVSKRTKQIRVFPLSSGRFGYRLLNSVAQGLIYFAARPEPMQ